MHLTAFHPADPRPREARAALGIVLSEHPDSRLAQVAYAIDRAAIALTTRFTRLRTMFVASHGELSWPQRTSTPERVDYRGEIDPVTGLNLLLARAFADAQVDWFLCLSPHAILHHRALAALADAARANPTALIEARRFPQEHPKNYCAATRRTTWACGDCLLIPRAVYEAIGGFDPRFTHLLADVDYSWQARRAGFSIEVCPQALCGLEAVRTNWAEPVREQQMLVAARYLSYKWGHEETCRWAETSLIDRGYYVDYGALPALPELEPWAKRDPAAIADFSRFYWFGETRWPAVCSLEREANLR